MKKLLFLAVLISAFFTACGGDSGSKGSDPEDGVGRDSTDQGGDKKPLPDIPALAMDSVDTEDDLPACVSSNEGDSVYVKAAYSIYRCDDGLWEPDGFVLQRVKSKDKLPECIKDRISMLVVTTDSSMVYRCGRESWTALGKMVVSETDLPNCTEKRNGEMAYVQETGEILVCDGRWTEQEFDDAVYCGSRSYDSEEKFCVAEKLYDLCGGKDFDPAMQFCYEDSLYALCGGEDYRPTRRFCVRDTLYDMCGGKDFDPAKKFCIDDELHGLCGGKSYDVDRERCEGGKVLGICGTETYDASKKFCSGDQTYDLCGGKSYDVTAKFCSGGQTYDLCGGASYDVTAKFCSGGQTYDLCDGEEYDVTEKFCSGGQTYDLCGGEEYDVTAKFCSGGKAYVLCGGSGYDVEEEHCVNGELKSCKALTYDKSTHFCDARDLQLYRFVTIDTQTWMAENLNYAYTGVPFDNGNYTSDSTSWCYDNDPANCAKYGRLYTWAAAMDSVGEWSTNGKGCGDGKECSATCPVRGVCPKGWHLPSQSEWKALIVAVDGYITEYTSSNTAGTKLKSVTGWNAYSGITNKDAFGFSALPAGRRGYYYGNYDEEGGHAYFWSSTETYISRTYIMYSYYKSVGAYLDLIDKSYGFSVRCLQD